MERESIQKLLNPKSMAVIGANDKNSYAGRFLRNIVNNNYKGIIYPINPNRDEVFGEKCYSSIKDVTGMVDLAVVIVKAEFVEKVIQDCADKGVGSILIITAGFSEFDPVNGPAVEQNIVRIARKVGIRILGPNCTGLANIKESFWGCTVSTLGTNPLNTGPSGLVSQSGAAGFGTLLACARDRNIGFKYIVTTGNEADLDVCELVDYMLDDDDLRSVAALIEGIKDIERFICVAKKAKRLGKSLAVLKIGESEIGSRAAASHTASITGDMSVFNSIAKQYGILKAEDYDELVELAKMTQSKYPLTGKRFAVLSHSGGVSSYSGDQLGKYGLEVPEFSEKTQKAINAYLKDFGTSRNPVDMTGAHMRSDAIIDTVRIIEENENIDAYLFATNGSPEQMKKPLLAAQSLRKPVFIVWTGSIYDEGLNSVRESGIPLCFSISKFAKLVSKVHSANTVKLAEVELPPRVKIETSGNNCYLNEANSKAILASAGVTVPNGIIITDKSQLASVNAGGCYAMKILSDTLIHKSDIGGVKLHLSGHDDLFQALDDLEKLKAVHKDEIKGYYLENMYPDGLDIVVGARLDEQFGWIIMVGIGGIYTELFKMTSIRSLPISRDDIMQMLNEIPGLSQLLNGYRGQPSYDREALCDAVQQISGIVMHNKSVLELVEINPLRVMPGTGGVVALDCVIKLK